jgi:aspartate/glutamate racemase
MKVVGIVGGLSWVASHDYYRRINEQVGSVMGKLHSSKIILVSLDLQEYADFLHDSNGNKPFQWNGSDHSTLLFSKTGVMLG